MSIRFDKDCGKVKIWQETSSEDGWCFLQDNKTKKFHVWDNGERESSNKCSDFTCDTLDEVFEEIQRLT